MGVFTLDLVKLDARFGGVLQILGNLCAHPVGVLLAALVCVDIIDGAQDHHIVKGDRWVFIDDAANLFVKLLSQLLHIFLRLRR